MTCKSKALGLALTLALALSALSATSAAAESFSFYSEVLHTDLTGTATEAHKFSVDAGSVSCETVTYEGEMDGEEASEATLTPTFEGCKAAGTLPTDVDMHSCHFVLTPETAEESTYHAELDIVCDEEGDSITAVTTLAGVVKCTIHIPAQTLGGVTLSEVSESDIAAVAAVEGITYTQTAGTGLGACAKGEDTSNGTFEGEVVVEGWLEELDATIALQPPSPVIAVDLTTKFTKVTDKQKINVYNLTDVKVEIKKFSFASEFFTLVNHTCGGQVEKGKPCYVELECKKEIPAGKSVYLVVESKTPRRLAAGELDCPAT